MGRYDPLFRHLSTISDDAMEMTFDEIEQLVGPLPATTKREWWTNDQVTRPAHARNWVTPAARSTPSTDLAGGCGSAPPDDAALDTPVRGAEVRGIDGGSEGRPAHGVSHVQRRARMGENHAGRRKASHRGAARRPRL
jgi:hypothetical protein